MLAAHAAHAAPAGEAAARARALARAGDHAAALAVLEDALRGQPRNRALRLDRAAALRELGRVAEAEAVCAEALAEAPALVPALLGLGHCARRRGDPEAALARFREAAGADAANPWGPLEAGHVLRELDRPEEAEAAYAEAAARRPDLVPALMALGHCARRRGDREAALARFREAARVNPGNPAARLELAAEARDAGDLDAARAAAEAVIAAAPGHAAAWTSLGLTERRAGRRAAARDAFRAAAERQPGAARPLVEQAAECLALGEAGEAATLLERAAALDPASAAPLEALAEQARIAGRLDEALALARQAIRRDPAGLPARLTAAQALFEAGRAAEAEAELDAAEAALGAGHHPAIVARRAALRRRAGDLPGALALARAAQAAAPGDFALWLARAQVEVLLTRDEAALEACLAAAPARRPQERALVAVCRGDAAELRGDRGAARRYLEEALRLNPAQPHPHHVLARLALLRWDADAVRRHLAEALRLEAGPVALQGRRNRVSQSLMGQILDDALMDRPLLDALAALEPLPPAERLPRIAPLVRDHPGATAPALALLVALRAAGPLRGAPAAPDSPAIPRAIGQYWDAAEPPADVLALMEGWRAAHPDHAVHRFSDATALAFLEAACAPAVAQAFLRAPEPAMRADLLRLAWLAAHGGLWVDADDRCLRPVGAGLIPPGATLFGYQEDVGTLGNNLLAAAPRHPVVLRALRLAVGAVNRGDEDLVWLATGPGLLTRALAEAAVAGAAPGAAPALPPGTVVLDRLDLAGAAAMHVAAAYKAGRRGHWMRAFQRGGGSAAATDGGRGRV